MVIFKIICLFLAVWFGFVNFMRSMKRVDVPTGNIIVMAIGIVGFVVIQFELYK